MRHPTRRAIVGILFFFCGLGCDRHPLVDGLPDKLDCSSCHGSSNNAAPPKAVDGETSTDYIGVGAHQTHLNGGSIAGPVACTECHVVPAAIDLLEHPAPIPAPATIAFGQLARTAGANPTWDHDSATCTNTYCHGVTLGSTNAPAPPLWTEVDGSQITCTSCHANSPSDLDASHPFHGSYTCDTCHAKVTADGVTILAPDLHINGQPDVSMAAGTWDPVARSCANTDCHGSGSISW
jgi:predicted CxxxxCH...CXXCH cytochrome family protein